MQWFARPENHQLDMDMGQNCDAQNEADLFRVWQSIVKESKSLPTNSTGNHPLKSQTNPKNNPLLKQKLKFARIYSDLIHSGRYTEKLIDLEFSYWPAVEDLVKTRDTSLDDLQARTSKEIEEAIQQLGKTQTEETISSLSSRHCQDLERLLKNWNMSIEALKESQREDFVDKVNLLWSEYALIRDSDSSNSNNRSDKEHYFSNLGLFDPKNLPESTYQIKMEESFTINLGSQLKTAHNLRILAVDSLYLCDTQRIRSPQIRTQTAMSLYSHNLSAVVLLVDNHFNSYYGIQQEFSKMCNSLNEFHFDNFSKQIQLIRDSVMPVHAGRSNLETGDCYITKHSNLSNAHVVFHLVTDDTLRQDDINSRHPILSSLRNILRVAHKYDIKTISIPLLLIDEMNEEILTVNWCLKRAELVLKRVKGFLIEMASLSTGVEQGTIQFLVPRGISEDLFASLAALIPDVFRLSNSVNLKTNNCQP